MVQGPFTPHGQETDRAYSAAPRAARGMHLEDNWFITENTGQ